MSSQDGKKSVHEPGISEQLRKWRRCDDTDRLHMRVTRAIRAAEVILYSDEATIDQRLKACTVIQQSARTAMAIIETVEIEERITALEEMFNQQTNGYALN